MVTELVNVRADHRLLPRHTAVAGQVRVHLVAFGAEGGADVANADNEPRRSRNRVVRREELEVGVPVQVEVALRLPRTGEILPFGVHERRLEEVPLAALVPRDHSPHCSLRLPLPWHPLLTLGLRGSC